jgi:hypothetical protein
MVEVRAAAAKLKALGGRSAHLHSNHGSSATNTRIAEGVLIAQLPSAGVAS